MRSDDVVLSPEAQADLDWIYDVVAAARTPKTALAYVDHIAASCRRLEYSPERGLLRDDLRPGLRIVGFERRVTIAFMVDAERVVILRVFYGGADWERSFE